MIVAMVLASGSGVRLGGDIPKQFLSLKGKPVYLYSLETFDRHPRIDRIVLVCHPEWLEEARAAMKPLSTPWEVVPGGETRMGSGENGLAVVPPEAEYVLIHDAARPFLDAELITRVIDAVGIHKAVVPAIAATDTMIEVEGIWIRKMPNRERLRRGQTPQAFSCGLIQEAFRRAREDQFSATTDDARLVHRLGHDVAWVDGAETNFKITTKDDFLAAERYLDTVRKGFEAK